MMEGVRSARGKGGYRGWGVRWARRGAAKLEEVLERRESVVAGSELDDTEG
jgi:hypothetical protein